jgi:hypothetical protein
MNRFIDYSQVITTNNYKTLKITVTAIHEIKSSVSSMGSVPRLYNEVEIPYE